MKSLVLLDIIFDADFLLISNQPFVGFVAKEYDILWVMNGEKKGSSGRSDSLQRCSEKLDGARDIARIAGIMSECFR